VNTQIHLLYRNTTNIDPTKGNSSSTASLGLITYFAYGPY